MKHWSESDVDLVCKSCTFSTRSLATFKRHIKRCVADCPTSSDSQPMNTALSSSQASSSFDETIQNNKDIVGCFKKNSRKRKLSEVLDSMDNSESCSVDETENVCDVDAAFVSEMQENKLNGSGYSTLYCDEPLLVNNFSDNNSVKDESSENSNDALTNACISSTVCSSDTSHLIVETKSRKADRCCSVAKGMHNSEPINDSQCSELNNHSDCDDIDRDGVTDCKRITDESLDKEVDEDTLQTTWHSSKSNESIDDSEKLPSHNASHDDNEDDDELEDDKVDSAILLQCQICNFTTTEHDQLVKHVSASHPRIYKCQLCEYISDKRRNVTMHRLVHGSKKREVHSCAECSYTTNSRQNFERHWAHHVTKGPYRCYRCSYSSGSEGPVRRHITIYHPDASDDDDDDDKEDAEGEGDEAEGSEEEEKVSNETNSAGSVGIGDADEDESDLQVDGNDNSGDESSSGAEVSTKAVLGKSKTNSIAQQQLDASRDTDNYSNSSDHYSLANGLDDVDCKDNSKNKNKESTITVEISRGRDGSVTRTCMSCDVSLTRYSDMTRHTKEIHQTLLKNCLIVDKCSSKCSKTTVSSPNSVKSLQQLHEDSNDTTDVLNSTESSSTLRQLLLESNVVNCLNADGSTFTALPGKPMKCAHCLYTSFRICDIRKHLAGAVENKYPCGHRPERTASHCNGSAGKNKNKSPRRNIFDSITRKDGNSECGKDSELLDGSKSEVYNGSRIKPSGDKSGMADSFGSPLKTYAGRKHRRLTIPASPSNTSYLAELLQSLPTVKLSRCCESERFPSDNSSIHSHVSDDADEPSKVHGGDCSREGPKDEKLSSTSVNLKCKICGYKCDPSEVDNHAKIHSTEKKFWCPCCSYKSVWKGDVKKHLVRCHKIKVDTPEKLERLLKMSFCIQEPSESMKLVQLSNIGIDGSKQKSKHLANSVSQNKSSKQEQAEGDDSGKTNSENEMDYEEALNMSSTVGNSDLNSINEEKQRAEEEPESDIVRNTYSKIAESQRWRPFKCSVCPRRSNWKWDIKKHIERSHPKGKIIKLSDEEAKRTFFGLVGRHMKKKLHSKLSKRLRLVEGIGTRVRVTDKEASAMSGIEEDAESVSPTGDEVGDRIDSVGENNENLLDPVNSAEAAADSGDSVVTRQDIKFLSEEENYVYISYEEKELDDTLKGWVDQLKLRRFKCGRCPFRSSYRGDLTRHFKVRHKTVSCSMLILSRESAAAAVSAGNLRLVGRRKLESIDSGKLVSEKVSDSIAGTQEKRSASNPTVFVNPMRKHSSHYDEFEVKVRRQEEDDAKCCNLCPYTTEKSGHMKLHMSYHKPQPRNTYKCRYCPFFVRTARLLNHHLLLHLPKGEGSAVAVGRQIAPNGSVTTQAITTSASSTVKYKYVCDQCPYVSYVRGDYWLHRRNHFPNASSPFKCLFCPYWVTDERLLAQHALLHAGLYCPRWRAFSEMPEYIKRKGSNTESESVDLRMDENDCRCVFSELYGERLGFTMRCGEVIKCPYCCYCVCSVLLMREHYVCHISVTDAARTPLFNTKLDSADNCLTAPCRYNPITESDSESRDLDLKGSDRVFHSESCESLMAPVLEPEVFSAGNVSQGEAFLTESSSEHEMPVLEQLMIAYPCQVKTVSLHGQLPSVFLQSLTSSVSSHSQSVGVSASGLATSVVWDESSEQRDGAADEMSDMTMSGDILSQAMQLANVLDSSDECLSEDGDVTLIAAMQQSPSVCASHKPDDNCDNIQSAAANLTPVTSSCAAVDQNVSNADFSELELDRGMNCNVGLELNNVPAVSELMQCDAAVVSEYSAVSAESTESITISNSEQLNVLFPPVAIEAVADIHDDTTDAVTDIHDDTTETVTDVHDDTTDAVTDIHDDTTDAVTDIHADDTLTTHNMDSATQSVECISVGESVTDHTQDTADSEDSEDGMRCSVDVFGGQPTQDLLTAVSDMEGLTEDMHAVCNGVSSEDNVKTITKESSVQPAAVCEQSASDDDINESCMKSNRVIEAVLERNDKDSCGFDTQLTVQLQNKLCELDEMDHSAVQESCSLNKEVETKPESVDISSAEFSLPEPDTQQSNGMLDSCVADAQSAFTTEPPSSALVVIDSSENLSTENREAENGNSEINVAQQNVTENNDIDNQEIENNNTENNKTDIDTPESNETEKKVKTETNEITNNEIENNVCENRETEVNESPSNEIVLNKTENNEDDNNKVESDEADRSEAPGCADVSSLTDDTLDTDLMSCTSTEDVEDAPRLALSFFEALSLVRNTGKLSL